ncbi:MAG: hypothetical protein AAF310_02975 [Myxococcota bacterium]
MGNKIICTLCLVVGIAACDNNENAATQSLAAQVDDNTAVAQPNPVQPPHSDLCGNGITEFDAAEQCDDGNQQTENCADPTQLCVVCNSNCQLQLRGAVTQEAVAQIGEQLADTAVEPPVAAAAICGNGIVEGGEQCDNDSTFCTATCAFNQSPMAPAIHILATFQQERTLLLPLADESIVGNQFYQFTVDTDGAVGGLNSSVTYLAEDAAGNSVTISAPITILAQDSQQFEMLEVGSEDYIEDVTAPQVAGLPDGGFVVVWGDEFDGDSDVDIYAQRYNDKREPMYRKDGVPTSMRVNAMVESTQENAAVAALSNGHFVVVWQHYSSNNSWEVHAQVFNQDSEAIHINAEGEPEEIAINTKYTQDNQESPQVIAFSDHEFAVVWYSGYANQLINPQAASGLYYKRYAIEPVAGGGSQFVSIDNEEIFIEQIDRFSNYTAAALRDEQGELSGDFVVAWEGDYENPSNNSTEDRIYFKLFKQNQGPLHQAMPIQRVASNGIAKKPAVAGLFNGDFVMIWASPNRSFVTNAQDIRGVRYTNNDEPVASEPFVIDGSESYKVSPSVSALPGDGFAVTWYRTVSGPRHTNIEAKLLDHENSEIGNTFTVNMDVSEGENLYGAKKDPDIATLISGEFVVVWRDQDIKISARLFNPVHPFFISASANPLEGGSGNDVLAVGYHAKTVTGGAGQDYVVVETQLPQSLDVPPKLFHIVTDFVVGQDRIVLRDLGLVDPTLQQLLEHVVVGKAGISIGGDEIVDAAVHISKDGGMVGLTPGELDALDDNSEIITIFLKDLGPLFEANLESNLQKLLNNGALVVP